MLGYCNI